MKNNNNIISIQGARAHNLKNINIDIPRNKLIVITGLSGSGKSSLAFDTIYAEGQRRYVESLSTYARQFLGIMNKPDVDSIEGLSPAISIEQKTKSKNPRSTVGTVTEIYDYLRLLYARIGEQKCYKCTKTIDRQTPQQIIDNILKISENRKIQILAPIIRSKKGEFKTILNNLYIEGFIKARIDNQIVQLDNIPTLSKNKKHSIEIIVDRLKITEKINKQRLIDSVELGLKLGQGLLLIDILGDKEYLYNQHLSCINCNISYNELEPRLFSFNSPLGACTDCEGLGTIMKIDKDRIVPDIKKSLIEGCIQPIGEQPSDRGIGKYIKELSYSFNFSYTTPWYQLPIIVKSILLQGTKKTKISSDIKIKSFEGLINNLERRYSNTKSAGMREWIEKFMAIQHCNICHGGRLKKEYLSVFINKLNIFDMCQLSIKDLNIFLRKINLKSKQQAVGKEIIKEVVARLEFLENVGLDYLSLSRNATTLSGGESQRIKLAAQIGLQLVGVLYVLDEPSIGLHPRDNHKLISTLHSLRDLDNTIIVVEHDETTMTAADWIIDIGPGAGVNGGEIIAEGKIENIIKNKHSITGQYLAKTKQIKKINSNNREKAKKHLVLNHATGNNLKKVTLKIPLNNFVCVTGVSGSGKSSLINQTLYYALAQQLYSSNIKPLKHEGISGLLYIDKVIDINQSPIGRTPRSNPATYTGVFTFIRELFCSVEESSIRGYKSGRFSFYVKGGRCESCQGMGLVKVEMHFLPDMYVKCELCNGKRFNRETLEIQYKSKNIHDILNMTVIEASEFFMHNKSISRKLKTLLDVGLGYIKLGQQATTLSGGESQRIKLSKELSKVYTGRTIYILDEPTTGLHFHDIQMLLNVLHNLTDKGNTVIVIEHNLDVIKTADWIIDLGPEGGENGGTIIFEGTPSEIINSRDSYTGQYLKEVL